MSGLRLTPRGELARELLIVAGIVAVFLFAGLLRVHRKPAGGVMRHHGHCGHLAPLPDRERVRADHHPSRPRLVQPHLLSPRRPRMTTTEVVAHQGSSSLVEQMEAEIARGAANPTPEGGEQG